MEKTTKRIIPAPVLTEQTDYKEFLELFDPSHFWEQFLVKFLLTPLFLALSTGPVFLILHILLIF